jgi:hypothetical protein
MVGSTLEYNNSGNISVKVSKRAPTFPKSCTNKSYGKILTILNQPTVKFRSLHSDMIDIDKIITGTYDTIKN